MKTEIKITEHDDGNIGVELAGEGCTLANLLGLLEIAKTDVLSRAARAAAQPDQSRILVANGSLPRSLRGR